MKVDYRLTPEAEQDLTDIWLYSRDGWGRAQANEYLGMIDTALEGLSSNPEIGKPREEVRPGFRSLPVGHHVVYYRLHRGWLEVVRVLHQRMDVNRNL